MFGYIICDKKGLDKEEIARYRAYYCGICRALSRYGQAEKMSLNYDLTFVAILLASLYDHEDETYRYRCMMHPLRNQEIIENEFVNYAADMTILLAYHKALDNWLDENKISSKKYAKSIEDTYKSLREKYPRQAASIENALSRLGIVEQTKNALPDDAIKLGGSLLSEIFVYKDDFWAGAIRDMGMYLGRFVYLMDATLDYKTDLRKGNYNPLLRMDRRPEEMDDILRMEIGNAVSVFEQLPLIDDVHLLRNILYSGVWTQYDVAGLCPHKDDNDSEFEDGITDINKQEQVDNGNRPI